MQSSFTTATRACFISRIFQRNFRLIDWWNRPSFFSKNFFISQPIYFILWHIHCCLQTCSIMTLTFWWFWHLTLFFNNFIILKFWISIISLSLVNGFTSYSHTMLLRSNPFHKHVASWPWPSDDLDIQHCSLTIVLKLIFSYNLFISWQIYFILTHNVALVRTFTLICHIVTFKW